jgi:hypothetical protein
VAAHDAEHLSDESARRPVRQADAPIGPRHAQHFAGGAGVVRREHHAERRQHDVERAVGEGKRFDVGFLERHRQPVRFGAAPPLLEQPGDVVRGRYVGPAPGGRERRVAVAGGHVQDFRPRAQVHGLA